VSLTRIARWGGHVDETMALLAHSRELCRQTGDMRSLSYVFFQMIMLAWRQGHLDEAARYIEQYIDIRRELSEGRMAPPSGQAMLALLSCEQGAYDRAEALCAQALDSPLAGHFARGLAFSALGRVALCRGDGARAVREYREALRHMQLEQNLHVLDHVEYLAWALAADGQAGEAARLLGFVGQQREVSGPALQLVDRPYHERALETVRGALSEADLAGAWAAGEALELEVVVERLLAEAPAADPPTRGEEE
ncbi:MAG: hypothetical protein ACK2VA_16240, partial [Anaerolineae bacterium]